MCVLNIGCGPGTISVGLAGAVDPGELHGIDMEESQVDIARATAAASGQDNATFQVGDVTKLPFEDEWFDAVHCHAVLMHIPDTMDVLAEVMRVLKPGGIVGAREHISNSSFDAPEIGNVADGWTMYRDLLTANGCHPQMGRELRARFREAGFLDVGSSGSFESFGPHSRVAAFTGFLINYVFSPSIADQAISHGIASQEGFDQWRNAAVEWNNDPGAFAALAWGEAIGRKRSLDL